MSTPLYQLKAEFFKTLGHPARIRVLELLSQREYTVAEMLPEVGIEPAHLSQQLGHVRAGQRVTDAGAFLAGGDQVRAAQHGELLGQVGGLDAHFREHLGHRVLSLAEQLPEVGIEPAHLSQQLAVLRRANLVTFRKEGSSVRYSLTSPHVAELLAVARLILTGVLSGQAELLDDLRASAS